MHFYILLPCSLKALKLCCESNPEVVGSILTEVKIFFSLPRVVP